MSTDVKRTPGCAWCSPTSPRVRLLSTPRESPAPHFSARAQSEGNSCVLPPPYSLICSCLSPPSPPGPIHELSRLSSKANPTPGISDTSPFADTRAFRSYFSPALSPLRALRGSLTSAYRRVVTASVFADSLSSAPPQLLHPFSATRSRSSPKGGLDLLPVPASFSKALRSGFCPHHPTKTFSSRLPMTARAPGGLSQSSVCLQLGS